MTTATVSAIVPKVTRLIVSGVRNSAGFMVGYISAGELARKVSFGPMVPGPWAYAFPLASVIDNHGGTGADIARERSAGTVVYAALGDVVSVEGLEYVILPENNDNIDFEPTTTPRGMLSLIPLGNTRTFYRGEARLEVTRDSAKMVAFRQGGRAGVWNGEKLATLARLMDDGQGEWKPAAE